MLHRCHRVDQPKRRKRETVASRGRFRADHGRTTNKPRHAREEQVKLAQPRRSRILCSSLRLDLGPNHESKALRGRSPTNEPQGNENAGDQQVKDVCLHYPLQCHGSDARSIDSCPTSSPGFHHSLLSREPIRSSLFRTGMASAVSDLDLLSHRFPGNARLF